MRVTRVAVAMAVLCGAAWGQRFDVASIKPNRARGASTIEFEIGGQRFSATNMPLGALILVAYDITVRQLSGPGEALSERYDVLAKAERPIKAGELRQMLQALLADRFRLRVRRETREVPVFALTLAKGGPKLRHSDQSEADAAARRTPAAAGGTESGRGRYIFKNESMADFAWALTRMAGISDRVVVDQTALNGRYDFELAFEREDAAGGDGSQGPSIFAAVQERLGLRLVPSKAPVEFIIVDRVEKPSEN